MVIISIGTAGWDYKDWKGTFYPKTLNREHHLEFYSRYFNIIEVNSSFYNLPSEEMVNHWNKQVPQNFRFIIKVWKEITHKIDRSDIDSVLNQFFQRFKSLEEKIEGFLFQFPPWFKFSESHVDKLKSIIKNIASEYRLLIELRDNSWFQPQILRKFINGKNRILVTTYKPEIKPYYLPDQDFYYIRLIGDRELTVFNRVQREEKQSLDHLFKKIHNLRNLSNIYEIFIIVNNHFQGHGPSSANFIKQRLGLPFEIFNQQKSLVEFLK